MLYWHLRCFQCIITGFFKSKIRPTDVITKNFWANVFDTDWLTTIYAGRFLTYSDASRWELAVRSGLFRFALKKKIVFILGGQKIIHRRPIRIFRRFSLTLQFVGWDEKWMYAAHVYRQNGKVCCVSFAKIGLRKSAVLYSPATAFRELGYNSSTPAPEWVLKQFRGDAEDLSFIESGSALGKLD